MKTVEYLGETWEVEDEAQFIAADNNGDIFYYTKKPQLTGSGDYYCSWGSVYVGHIDRPYELKEI